MLRRTFFATIAAVVAFAPLAHADGPYPSKPIRLVVPFAPGGTSEIVARAVAQQLTTQLGQSVFVENKAGGAGTIAMAEVAKAAPDGYTLILGHVGTLAVNPYAMARQPYDVNRDFVPVALLARVPNLFVVNANVPAKDFKEFVALAKKEPGKLNYGSAGAGSVNHLALELMNARADIVVVHVPYRGIADATKDLLGGAIQSMTASIPATLPLVAEKRVKVLAVTGAKRIPQLPGVPSWQEEGVPNANVVNYWGIVAPAGTPPAIVARLNADVQKVLAQPDVRERLEREGAELIPGPPERLGALIEADLNGWKKLIVEAKLSFE